MTTPAIRAEKRALRARMLAARRALPDDERARAHASMTARLLALADEVHARRVAVYAAAHFEADPWGFAEACLARGVTVLWPRVTEPDRLTFHAVDHLDRLVPGYRGLMEPPPGAPEEPVHDLELILTPGVAFDAQGHRLGRGGGYYDRLLGRCPGPLAVGLAYAVQVVERVPVAPHDRPVDVVVTEAARLDRAGAR